MELCSLVFCPQRAHRLQRDTRCFWAAARSPTTPSRTATRSAPKTPAFHVFRVSISGGEGATFKPSLSFPRPALPRQLLPGCRPCSVSYHFGRLTCPFVLSHRFPIFSAFVLSSAFDVHTPRFLRQASAGKRCAWRALRARLACRRLRRPLRRSSSHLRFLGRVVDVAPHHFAPILSMFLRSVICAVHSPLFI